MDLRDGFLVAILLFFCCLLPQESHTLGRLPKAYRPPPHLPLEGGLSRNARLCGASRLLDGLVSGPESLAERQGQLYTGLNGGHVVRIDPLTDQVTSVAKFGRSCEGPWDEEACGRPAGVKFASDGTLIVADMYYGLFRVDVDTGQSWQLVSVNQTIAGRRPGLPNGVETAPDGSIFWSDSSTAANFRNAIVEFLDDASGRVLRLDPETGANTVLADELRFPNGLLLTPDQSHLYIAETGRNRILRCRLSDGSVSTLVEGLPGAPDGLRPGPSGAGVLAALISTDTPSRATLPELLAPLPKARAALLLLLRANRALLATANTALPLQATRRITHVLGHTETVFRETMARSMVVWLDDEGGILTSLQCPSGTTRYISEAIVVGNNIYLASPFNNYIGRLPTESLLSQL
ncbi:adipocyte plasma membrane-associated protein Hemomucin-like [Schistocerca nitens]|uniref:adipocyte plasma membrane-associated protein Hemomucin-like n=1 Tax=Schistocerca nitens TaxID=7011 RepID=UPI0021183522|nr:adipocyte plasma membrane-associated protein Hemomucin-like [Schistocerca nitens]